MFGIVNISRKVGFFMSDAPSQEIAFSARAAAAYINYEPVQYFSSWFDAAPVKPYNGVYPKRFEEVLFHVDA